MSPERFSNEWFEWMQNWEGDHFEMLEEYHALLKYRRTEVDLEEFPKEVRHRLYSGG